MNNQAIQQLVFLSSSMPQQKTIDPEFYLEALKECAEGCSDEAIIEAARNCRNGLAPDVTNGFCPSPDKFGPYVKKIHEIKEANKRYKALPAPTHAPQQEYRPDSEQERLARQDRINEQLRMLGASTRFGLERDRKPEQEAQCEPEKEIKAYEKIAAATDRLLKTSMAKSREGEDYA